VELARTPVHEQLVGDQFEQIHHPPSIFCSNSWIVVEYSRAVPSVLETSGTISSAAPAHR
jgi:hypothetical protein